MKGAPRKIQRKQGVEVTQVREQKPPSVPAIYRRKRARIAVCRHEAHELQHHDQRPGVAARPSSISAGLQPAVEVDRLPGDIGEHRVGAAEGDHRRSC